MTRSRAADVAIERAYRSGFPAFLRVAVAIVGEEQLARDAVHDGFVQALRHAGRFRGEGPIEGWLWRIVVNEARKRRGRRGPVPLSEPAPEPAESTNGNSEAVEIRVLLGGLPERQRLTLFLRYYADLDYEAIASALDVSPGTVAATLNAAHRSLRSKLEEVLR